MAPNQRTQPGASERAYGRTPERLEPLNGRPESAAPTNELNGPSQPRLHKTTASNLPFLSALIWTIILLSQSTAANSVFLESCSSNAIQQVFCHRDQLYVIQDSTLYYGNSCGQMMTNETIRVTKKFKTAVSMRSAFIDDKNSILLFSVSINKSPTFTQQVTAMSRKPISAASNETRPQLLHCSRQKCPCRPSPLYYRD